MPNHSPGRDCRSGTPVELAARLIVLHCKANPISMRPFNGNPMEHEPRRLLRQSKGAVKVPGANAVLAVGLQVGVEYLF